jgi:hypothetical protein
MRRSFLLIALCAALFSATGAKAQVVEGGAIRDVRLSTKFPGLTAVLSSPEVAKKILSFTARNESYLSEVSYSQETLQKATYTFTLLPKNGAWIGSSSFAAEVSFRQGGDPRVKIVDLGGLE